MNQDFLDKIVAEKKALIERKKPFFDGLVQKLKGREHTAYHLFRKAISKPGEVNLIAEVKKASPSKGLICKNFSVPGLARKYANAGTAAFSVLTEEKFFLGKPPYVRDISENFPLPVLAKYFFLDEVQIYEAFSFGASAILLIVAILTDEELKHLLSVAASLDIDCLVEVHNEEELGRALKASAQIIGINNRNLHTFEVDFETSKYLIPLIPRDKIIVSESGIHSHDQIKTLQGLGANAVLIGETFLRAADVEGKIKEIMHGAH